MYLSIENYTLDIFIKIVGDLLSAEYIKNKNIKD